MALYVIQGPPASGKSTWVRERAQHGDVVVDMDVIASALTVDGDGHSHPPAVLRCAIVARAAVIDEALKRCGEVDVYVIHALPPAQALARYAAHGAHMVTIDPGRDVVERRIRGERHYSARTVATRWYDGQGHALPSHAETSRAW